MIIFFKNYTKTEQVGAKLRKLLLDLVTFILTSQWSRICFPGAFSVSPSNISFDNPQIALELFEIYGFLKSNISFVLMVGFLFFSPFSQI